MLHNNPFYYLARKTIKLFIDLSVMLFAIFGISMSLATLFFRRKKHNKPRLLWAAKPIKSLAYAAQALEKAGYQSETAVIEIYPIVKQDDFNHCLFGRIKGDNPLGYAINAVLTYWFFLQAIHKYDIFHYYFDGGILQRTIMRKLELPLLRVANKKIIVMPYGSDSFVYDQIPNPSWQYALNNSYRNFGRRAKRIQNQIRHMTRFSDCIVGCLVHTVNLPVVDVLPLTWYPVNMGDMKRQPVSLSGPITIAHAPNHRGPKGTPFLLDAVERLRMEGHDVNLLLIENVSNTEALRLINQCDIFVDQLIFGYALAAMEGMALGKVVISGIDPSAEEYKLFRRYSYLDECPVIPAQPETIYVTLKNLILNREKWTEISAASHEFAQKRHSDTFTVDLFEHIYGKIWYRQDVDLHDLYRIKPEPRAKN